MFSRGKFIVAAAALGAVACSSATRSNTAAGVLAPEFAASSASLSTANISLLASMSSAERVAHFVADDSMQIAMGRVALRRANNGMIRIFAQHVVNDHSGSLQHLLELAKQRDYSLEPAIDDPMPGILFTMLDSLNYATDIFAFDRTFILSEIQMHQRMLTELEALRDLTTDPVISYHVMQTVPMVQQHLEKAKKLASQLKMTGTP